MKAVRSLTRALVFGAAVLAIVALGIRWRFGGGSRLPDLTTAPRLAGSALEVVADLEYPPGNIAVSRDGRVFITLHPDGKPPMHVVELVGGKPVPYPNEEFQRPAAGAPHFQTPLSMRIDRQDRLWVLDHAEFGQGQPRLLAFDLATGRLVHRYDVPSEVAGFLSMLNDFQVAPDGSRVYIAESSPLAQTPALVVYDVTKRAARRLLEGHRSVQAMDYRLNVEGRDMVALGIYTLRIGVDSIALDSKGEWLYYGPVNGDRLFRVATRDLDDPALDAAALGARVQEFGPKTASDGLTMDLQDDVYITDPEHSAILTLGQSRALTTVLKDPRRLRWPDGLSFGPDGWLYVTCSALQHVLLRSQRHQDSNAPYQVYRFKPGPIGIPGH